MLKLTGRSCFGARPPFSVRPVKSVPVCRVSKQTRPELSPEVASAHVNTFEDSSQLVCPICQETKFQPVSKLRAKGLLHCDVCQRSFEFNSNYLDLTITSGTDSTSYSEVPPIRTSTFQNPLVGFIYERGWRQGFSTAGFPGEAKEFERAMDFLSPVTGGAVMDLSCGSGLFTRRLAGCGKFEFVFAVDFSAAMLVQTQRYLERDTSTSSTPIVCVRADAGRLPFASGSMPAIHSGAAIHCWPSPLSAMAEVSRVLEPGGIFVCSTFLRESPSSRGIISSQAQALSNALLGIGSPTFNFLTEEELRYIARTAGLCNFKCYINRRFIMFSVNKAVGTTDGTSV